MSTRRVSKTSLSNRDRYLRRTYNITEAEYNVIFKYQHSRCGACGKKKDEFTSHLAVDHDHRTGLVRGLLCYYCNRWVIGKHRPEKIIGAANYLDEWPAQFVLRPGMRRVPGKEDDE